MLGSAALSGCAPSPPRSVEVLHAAVQVANPKALKLSLDACHNEPYDVHVSESVNEVVITVTTTTPTEGPASPSCSDLTAVELQAPLAARRLIDASTRRSVPVDAPPAL
ncbi:hypothetical protein [Phycicoccus ginsengisoli]